jgi:peptidoglycan pentaglycine glycine transferase (the first glycine)
MKQTAGVTPVEILKKEGLDEYKKFLEGHPKGHFMQSPQWGRIKSDWKWEAVVQRDEGGKIKAGVSVLIRKVPGLPYTMMYSPRGPVCDLHDKDTLALLVAGVRALAIKYKAYIYKIDPDIPVSDTLFAQHMRSFGFRLSDNGKNFEGVQPKFVFRLDIREKTEDEIFALFHQKTRYNIRLAQRHDVAIRVRDETYLDELMPIMVETGRRDGFATRPKSYFERLLKELGEKARLYIAYYQDKPVAGAIASQYGDKTWYLYGASSSKYRNIMPNHLLQWEMIRWAVSSGCRIYDFRGVSGDLREDNPLYGLYRFKKGFGGEFTEFIGEFDLILNRQVAGLIESGYKLRRNFIQIRNKRQSPAE